LSPVRGRKETKAVKLLVKKGAIIDVADNAKKTVLMYAAEIGLEEVVKFLTNELGTGATAEAVKTDNHKLTAVGYAIKMLNPTLNMFFSSWDEKDFQRLKKRLDKKRLKGLKKTVQHLWHVQLNQKEKSYSDTVKQMSKNNELAVLLNANGGLDEEDIQNVYDYKLQEKLLAQYRNNNNNNKLENEKQSTV
jgi:hypothetical protein